MSQALNYGPLIEQLADRSTQSTLSTLGIKNTALRKHLVGLFSCAPGEGASFLSDPVFEAAFGWKTADSSMHELEGQLLSPALVRAMDKPPAAFEREYRFGREWQPYEHQLEAWQTLLAKEPRPAVITSGTGSGKTECFLVPILNDLAREIETENRTLEGVRALFLYPLNALINSQKDRLEAWTSGFDGKGRFCLYNGATPERLPASFKRSKVEVQDRAMLRSAPPPVLLTNSTMLEYMLVRGEDAPILKKSQGSLRWIVMDEAHSYLGSQAAELSLLLRRVIHAFGVKADDVRFVATSATIGGDDYKERLRDFLAGVAGVSRDRVSVISGKREAPLPSEGNGPDLPLEAINAIDPQDSISEHRFSALCSSTTAKTIRRIFVDNPALSLKEVQAHLGGGTSHDALAWLDACSGASKIIDDGRETFVPLRAHLFHRVTAGLWACPDVKCSAKRAHSLIVRNGRLARFIPTFANVAIARHLFTKSVFAENATRSI